MNFLLSVSINAFVIPLNTSCQICPCYTVCFHAVHFIITLTAFGAFIVQLYPLWLCPFVLPNRPGFVHPRNNTQPEMYVDIGAYGAPKSSNYKAVETTRCLEKFVREHNG